MPKRAVENPSGKRVPLNMKTTVAIRAKLEAAAAASGRSLTQEVEWRIERSFLLDEHNVDVTKYKAGEYAKADNYTEKRAILKLRTLGYQLSSDDQDGNILSNPNRPAADFRATGRVSFIKELDVEPGEAAEPLQLKEVSAGLEARVERVERALEQAGILKGEEAPE